MKSFAKPERLLHILRRVVFFWTGKYEPLTQASSVPDSRQANMHCRYYLLSCRTIPKSVNNTPTTKSKGDVNSILKMHRGIGFDGTGLAQKQMSNIIAV